jgi:hypothetical protein
VAGDDLRVLLEEAQELLRGRNLFPTQDAASGLIDPSLHQRQEVLNTLQQTFGSTYSVRLQGFEDFLCGLRATCLGNRNQLLVGLFEILFGLLALTPSLVLCSF